LVGRAAASINLAENAPADPVATGLAPSGK